MLQTLYYKALKYSFNMFYINFYMSHGNQKVDHLFIKKHKMCIFVAFLCEVLT